MLRTVIPLFVAAIVLSGLFLYQLVKQPDIIVEQQTVTQEVEVEVDVLSELIQDGLVASSSEHAAEAQVAYDETFEQLQKEKELEIIRDYRSEIEMRESQLEEETQAY